MNIKHIIFSLITVIGIFIEASSWGAAASPKGSQKANYHNFLTSESPLISAAANGNTETVNALIDNKADVNFANSLNGNTPLIEAADKGHTETVIALIDKKANVNLANSLTGDTPLIFAADKGHTETVQALIDKKADVHQANAEKGTTPLIFAACDGHTETVNALIDNKADVNFANSLTGDTPLIWAAYNGHTETVNALIDNKADVNFANAKNGDTPLIWAADKGHTETVIALIDKKANVSQANKNGDTPLISAADKGHTETVNALIDKKADVNLANSLNGDTPLILAADNGHTETVIALIDNKADANLANFSTGNTPLILAASKGHTETVKTLIDKKADVNLANKNGTTPLIEAAYNGHTETVKTLIDKRADVNLANFSTGTTPLILAASYGYTEIAQALITAGANVNLANSLNGNTPLAVAAHKGYTEIVKALLIAEPNNLSIIEAKYPTIMKSIMADDIYVNSVCESAIKKNNYEVMKQLRKHISFEQQQKLNELMINDKLLRAAANGDINKLKQALDNGANINVTDENGCTPLILAVENGHRKIVKHLIFREADVNKIANDGRTALNCAVKLGYNTIQDILMKAAEAHANKGQIQVLVKATPASGVVPVQTTTPTTPLVIDVSYLLINAAKNGDIDQVRTLLSTQVDIDTTDSHGYTALRWAIVKGNKVIIALLIEKGASITAVLSAAIRTKDLQCVQMMTKLGMEKDVANELLKAAKNNNLEVVSFLLTAGADVNATNDNNCTALILAATDGYTEIVKHLIGMQADVSRADRANRTALIKASFNGHAAVVDQLIKANANVHAIDINSRTALMMAAANGHAIIIDQLIEANVEVNAADINGSTALMIAAVNGHETIVEQLLHAKADINATDKKGRTALGIATEKNHETIARLIAPGATNIAGAISCSDEARAAGTTDCTDDARAACDADNDTLTSAIAQAPSRLHVKGKSNRALEKSPATSATLTNSQTSACTEPEILPTAQSILPAPAEHTALVELPVPTELPAQTAEYIKTDNQKFIEIETPYATYRFYKLYPIHEHVTLTKPTFFYDETPGRPGDYLGKWNDVNKQAQYPNWFKNDTTCNRFKHQTPHLLCKAIPVLADFLLASDNIAFPQTYIDCRDQKIDTINIVGQIIPKIILVNGAIQHTLKPMKPIDCVFTWGFKMEEGNTICYHRCAQAVKSGPKWLMEIAGKNKGKKELTQQSYEADFPSLTPTDPNLTAEVRISATTKWLEKALGKDRFSNLNFEKENFQTAFPALDLTLGTQLTTVHPAADQPTAHPASDQLTSTSPHAPNGKGAARQVVTTEESVSVSVPANKKQEFKRIQTMYGEGPASAKHRDPVQTAPIKVNDGDMDLAAAIAASLEN